MSVRPSVFCIRIGTSPVLQYHFTGVRTVSLTAGLDRVKTMRHIRPSSIPTFPLKLEMLSYPHKIDCTRLTYVCYGSFMGSETLETYEYNLRQFNDSMETVLRQTVI